MRNPLVCALILLCACLPVRAQSVSVPIPLDPLIGDVMPKPYTVHPVEIDGDPGVEALATAEADTRLYAVLDWCADGPRISPAFRAPARDGAIWTAEYEVTIGGLTKIELYDTLLSIVYQNGIGRRTVSHEIRLMDLKSPCVTR